MIRLYISRYNKEYENLRCMFNYFDTDQDGFLTSKDAVNLWGLLGYSANAFDITKFGDDKINHSGTTERNYRL